MNNRKIIVVDAYINIEYYTLEKEAVGYSFKNREHTKIMKL